jgi:hypothetical protein
MVTHTKLVSQLTRSGTILPLPRKLDKEIQVNLQLRLISTGGDAIRSQMSGVHVHQNVLVLLFLPDSCMRFF